MNIDLAQKDLNNYFAIADSIADLIGPHCEVLLHSIDNFDSSVVKIVNGHLTNRKVGSPITDIGLKMLNHYEKTGELSPKSYFTKSKTGDILKSTSSILLDNNQHAIGMLCININISAPFTEIIQSFTPNTAQLNNMVNESFAQNSSEVIDSALKQAQLEVQQDSNIHAKSVNKTITKKLFDNGLFELKETTNIVALHLGITKHTIYKFLREFRTL